MVMLIREKQENLNNCSKIIIVHKMKLKTIPGQEADFGILPPFDIIFSNRGSWFCEQSFPSYL